MIYKFEELQLPRQNLLVSGTAEIDYVPGGDWLIESATITCQLDADGNEVEEHVAESWVIAALERDHYDHIQDAVNEDNPARDPNREHYLGRHNTL